MKIKSVFKVAGIGTAALAIVGGGALLTQQSPQTAQFNRCMNERANVNLGGKLKTVNGTLYYAVPVPQYRSSLLVSADGSSRYVDDKNHMWSMRYHSALQRRAEAAAPCLKGL